jgi:hypothetical protein
MVKSQRPSYQLFTDKPCYYQLPVVYRQALLLPVTSCLQTSPTTTSYQLSSSITATCYCLTSSKQYYSYMQIQNDEFE